MTKMKLKLFGGTMAKTLLAVMLCLTGLPAMADDTMLQVWLADGQVVSINLDEEPRTTYNNGSLVITTTKTTITYPLEHVKRYTYTLGSADISSPQSSSVTFSSDGETLTFNGLKHGTLVLLFSSTGQLIRSFSADSSSRAVVSVSQLSTGVYIVKTNGATYKITKR